MTIHGSKSELKQLRYPENRAGCVSLLTEAITSNQPLEFYVL